MLLWYPVHLGHLLEREERGRGVIELKIKIEIKHKSIFISHLKTLYNPGYNELDSLTHDGIHFNYANNSVN